MREHRLGHEERRIGRPAEAFLGLAHVFQPKRRTVSLEAILLRRTEAEMRAYRDQCWPRQVGSGGLQGRMDRGHVGAIRDGKGLPAVRLEPLRAILGETHGRAGRQRDAVVVIQADQLAKPEMPCQRRGLGCHALHQVTVADDCPGAVINERVSVAVVAGGQMGLADRQSDRVGQSLAQRTSGQFDAGSKAALGMARRAAAQLAEFLQVFQRQVVAGQVEQTVKQGRAVPGR